MTNPKKSSAMPKMQPFHVSILGVIGGITVSSQTAMEAAAKLEVVGTMIQSTVIPKDVSAIKTAFELKLNEVKRMAPKVGSMPWVTMTLDALDDQAKHQGNGADGGGHTPANTARDGARPRTS